MPIPRPAPGSAKRWVVATTGILLGSAMAVWWGLASTVGKPSWTLMSYHVVDDRNVDVTYLVSRPTVAKLPSMALITHVTSRPVGRLTR